MSRNGNDIWPPKSYDLTPLDYLLSDYVKSPIYKKKTQLISELKNDIIDLIGAIELEQIYYPKPTLLFSIREEMLYNFRCTPMLRVLPNLSLTVLLDY